MVAATLLPDRMCARWIEANKKIGSMNLKYSAHHKSCDCECPSASCEQAAPASNGYRFVSNDPVNPTSDFLPVAIEKPERGFKNSAKRCQAFALSYFNTLAAAKKRWESLAKSCPAVFKKKNLICETNFCDGDGLFCPVNSSTGHFDFHEAESCDLSPRSQVVLEMQL